MKIKDYLGSILEKVFENLNINKDLAKATFSEKEGVDLQCNASFVIAKELRKSPIEVANLIVEEFNKINQEFEISVANPGFINFKICDSLLTKIANDSLKDDRCNVPKLSKTKKMILDYGGANVAKPLHIGHMRSAIIGQALNRLNQFLGNTVISDVHLGDWGLQMGLTIAQLMDDFDMGYYFGENKPKVEITVEMLDEAYPKASARKKEDEEFMERASNITLLLQQKAKGYYDIWQEFWKVSVDMVRNSYLNFRVDFDLWNGESTVNDSANELIENMKKTGLIHESNGAFIMEVEKEGDKEPMPPALIQKHNGAQMYIITDVATIWERCKQYKDLDKILYLTDNRQGLHFKQVFRVAEKAKLYPENVELEHITFGTVNGKDGKPFKTRDGGTVKLDDVFEIITSKAYEKLKENNMEPDYELAKKIGLSALLFGDMINVISKDYMFDFDKFCSFDGKTGPYLQYTAVRIKSLLAKAGFNGGIQVEVNNDYLRKIVIQCLKVYDSLFVAYNENSLNSICSALFDLASCFSNLYNDVKILKIEDEIERNNYLAICSLVYKTLELGLGIIGIEIPEYM